MEEDKAEEEDKVVGEDRVKAAEADEDKAGRGKVAWADRLPEVQVASAFAQNADKENLTREESHVWKRNVQNVGRR